MCKSLNFVLFFALIGAALSFDKNIKVSHLAGCREIVLDGKNSNTLQTPISSLSNNNALSNEVLRMRFFGLDFDFYIFLKGSATANSYHRAVISGWGRKLCAIQALNFSTNLAEINCEGLQDEFYYSEFTLVITKDGQIQFYKSKDTKPFMSIQVNYSLPYISFGKFNDGRKARVLFDCPRDI
ncbi:hypothetical protein ACFFRR_007982 [Megaselia abdita]